VLVVSVVLSPGAWADGPVPQGYRLEAQSQITTGVQHQRLVRDEPPLVVNIARIASGAPVSLRAVLSNEQVAGQAPRLERTSSMCTRVHCLLALNGDFAAVGSDQPIGGFVTGGQLLRSPSPTHHQLSVTEDGTLRAGSLEWSGKLMPTDLQPIVLNGVNTAVAENQVVLYTPAFGASTQTSGPGASLVLRNVEPAGALRLNQTTMVELLSFQADGADRPIPADGAVLAGRGEGADALRRLWGRVQSGAASAKAFLRLETPAGVVESVGGSPILLRDGKRWFAEADDNFTQGRHPRTIVGWNAAGEVLMVTVDGRDRGRSVGMTLAEATELMSSLGATEAINLDGGGSTTFVAQGVVVNEPSDVAVRNGGGQAIFHTAGSGDRVLGHVERPVASALTLVSSNEVAVPPTAPLAVPSLGLSQALAAVAPASSDPGSVPDGALPALLSPPASDLGREVRVGAVAANLSVALALGALMVSRRRRAGDPGSRRAGTRRRLRDQIAVTTGVFRTK
jgi:Phosphodiester glycosidase